MSKKDYYGTLGITKTATKDEIKKAYNQLAKKYHPDINKSKEATEKFPQISEAYEVLSDDTKRSNYDQFGSAEGNPYGGFDQGGFHGFNEADFSADMFGDIFGNMFGFGGSTSNKSHSSNGSNVEFKILLTLEEAFNGIKKKFAYSCECRCKNCSGNGYEGVLKTCNGCGGSGMRTMRMGAMSFSASQCNMCNGRGKTGTICTICAGTGKIHNKTTIEVDIPAGIDNGYILKKLGMGNSGTGSGKDGDFLLHVELKPHSKYTKLGNDLSIKIPVTLDQVLLGKTITLMDLDGSSFVIQIPTGHSPTNELIVRNRGFKSNHNRGNLHVIFQMNDLSISNESQIKFEEFWKTVR